MLRLEGSLCGPFVEELESCWSSLREGTGSRPLVVDLQSLTFVSAKGRELLARMYCGRAQLLGKGVMARSLVEQIVAGVSRNNHGGGV